MVASGLDLRINNGGNKIVNLANPASRTPSAPRNNFSVDLYSDGTLANQINGLQALVSDTGAGTVGGIDSSTWTFWKNKVQSAAAPIGGGAAVTPSASTIESLMLGLWLELVRGDDKPDLLITSNDYFSMYEQSQVAIKRYTSSDEADGGFASLKYKNADIIFDGGNGIPPRGCTSSTPTISSWSSTPKPPGRRCRNSSPTTKTLW